MTPVARNAIGMEDAKAIEARERALGVSVGALRSFRNRDWVVSVTPHGAPARAIRLRGKGPLAVVIAGALDDFESQEAGA